MYRGVGESALRGIYHGREPLEFRRPKKIRFITVRPHRLPNEATGFHPSAATLAPDARSEWKRWPSLPVKAYQPELKEMARSVDSLNARDTPVQWIRADLG